MEVLSTRREDELLRPPPEEAQQKLVAFALKHGLKATAREFACSRNTVRTVAADSSK